MIVLIGDRIKKEPIVGVNVFYTILAGGSHWNQGIKYV